MGDAGLTGRTAAVIFARGTGDAVPFLSARLLAGKPLLHYTIEAVRKARSVSAVFVSTEDERIAAVAREGGASVLLRPEALSRHETPMDAAVSHAARALKRRPGPRFTRMACVQADAVFCDPRKIDEAVGLAASGGYDRVIGVVPEFKKLVVWRQRRSFELLLPPPHLRREGERHFSEPGVLTVWRLGPSGVSPASRKVGKVELEERSAFRVDTEHDIRLAARLLGPRRLALRCDGSPKMGMGHVMRLLNIARHLSRPNGGGAPAWTSRFFVGSDHLEGARMLTERGLDVDVVRAGDPEHWVRRIEEFDPQLVVNDLPFVPARYSELLFSLPAKAVTLVDSVADIDPKTERLDTVISLIKEKLTLPHNRYHAGPAFAAFHPSILGRLEGAAREGGPRKDATAGPLSLLVALGTGDPLRLTRRVVETLAQNQDLVRGLTVMLRKEHQDARFKRVLARFRAAPTVVTSPSDRLGDYLARADAAVVSGGITAYEASALGVPSIVLCQNQRELKRMQQFERNGSVLLLGLGDEVTDPQIARAVRRLAQDASLRRRLSERGLKLSDGRGIERISGLITELLGEKTP